MRAHIGMLSLLVGLIAWVSLPRVADGQAERPAALSGEDEADRRLIAQLLAALEKIPRRGTVLDRVYGHHVERGRLDDLIEHYRKEAQAAGDGGRSDGVAWMIVGLLEAQRGRDGAAVAALEQAERLRPSDALASYYLGHSLLLIGQPERAAEALERAIARRPSNRNDLLEIYQELGRLHDRVQHPDRALAVWRRLEEQFPDDIRVRERIAAALAEDGQLEPALARYQDLAKNGEERLKQPLFRIAAADLKSRLGRRDQAVADFENLLSDLLPEDWLSQDTRQRLEEVFLRDDDLAGLVAHYEGQIARHPDDLVALARLAHYLESLGRTADARKRLEDGLRRAPRNVELRRALIGLLVDHNQLSEALSQYEQLDRVEPNHPDHLREWGQLCLRDTSKPEAERRRAAAEVWKRLISGGGRRAGASVVEQVGDLFRQAGMADEALALYRQAVEMEPGSVTQRIHLGEYLHSLDRRAEALSTWRVIAEGPRRDARSLKTLAGVLSDFNYRTEAIEALTAARALAPNDLDLALQLADVHHRFGQYAAALSVLESCARLAAGPDQLEQVLSRRIQVEQAAGTLEERAAGLEKSLAEGRESGAPAWYRLARFREAARQWPAAAVAIRRARDGLGSADGASQAPIWSSVARILEGTGDLSQAADALRRLAAVEIKDRSEALRNIARIESKLNHRDAALQAGRDLLAAAPGDAEHYRFFANLCFQLDAREEAIEVLRRAVRVDPNDPAPLLGLAQALAEAGRPDEAIELDWRAFEKTDDVAGKRAIVGTLTGLYLAANQFDRLLERLERLRRDRDRVPEQRRAFTLCIAQAHQVAGDLGTARHELERLLADRPGDIALLQQLTALAEKEGDLTAAVGFQQQLARVAPRGNQDHLVSLLLRLGEVEQAVAIWQREADAAQGTRRLLDLTDNLLFFGQAERALPLIVRVLRDRPRDWEALYREGVALSGLKRPDEAARRFESILDLDLPDDEPSVLISPGAGSGAARKNRTRDADDAVFDRLEIVPRIRQEVGLDPRNEANRTFWIPADFGQARMAALSWLHTLSRRTKSPPQSLARLRSRHAAAGLDIRGWWDWLYLQRVLGEHRKVREATRALVKTAEPPTQRLFLMYLIDPTLVQSFWAQPEVPLAGPLSAPDVEQVAASLRILLARRPDWIDAEILIPAFAALKQAKRGQDEQALFRETVAVAVRSRQIVSLMGVAANRGDAEALLQLFARLDGRSWASTGPNAYPSDQIGQAFQGAMDFREEAGAFDDVARLVDGFLDSNRRRSQAARARPAYSPSIGDPIGSQLFAVGDHRRTLSMEFPAPTDFLDRDALLMLGDAFMLFDRVDRVDDLIAHVHGRLARAAPADQSYDHVVLCGFHWWNDERDSALAELEQAVAAAPRDPTLRLELARMHETLGRPDEAAADVEAIPTPDQAALRLRELAALRLAVRSGKIDRARLAAERLFALRLDAPTGLQVASSMQQIGLRDQGAALLDRVRTQGGGRLDVLLGLLTQYQSQNRPEAAAEVAYRILRVSGPPSPGSRRFNPFRNDDTEAARAQAIEFLARAGKLAALIARAEAQLKASPRSYHLLQTLREYYMAVPDAVKARSTLERMLALRLDDPVARFQLAGELAQSAGGTGPVLEHSLAALRAQPSLFSDWSNYQLVYQFQAAGKLPELVAALDQPGLDDATLRRYIELLATLIDRPDTRADGLRRLRSIARRPGYPRGTIIPSLASHRFGSSGSTQKVLALPELYDIVRDDLIPQPGETTVETWSGVESFLPDFLVGAAKQNHLSDLAEAVGRAAAARPEWAGGKVLLALIDVHRGRFEQARDRLLPLIGPKDAPIPLPVRRLIVRELAVAVTLHDLSLRLIEREKEPMLESGQASYQGSLTSIHVRLYRSVGRIALARELVLDVANKMLRGRVAEDDFYSSTKLQSIDAIGRELIDLDAPIAAARIYGSILERRPVEPDPRRSADEQWASIIGSTERALQSIRTVDPSAMFDELIPDGVETGRAVDPIVFVFPPDPERQALVSVFDEVVTRAATEPILLDRLRSRLERACKSRPRDLGAHLGAALAALAARQDESMAIERLEGLVADLPLAERPAGRRVTARERSAAAEQVGLWLVARACLRRPALRLAGTRLGSRALEAARLRDVPASTLAILREWGQIERDRGDRAAGDARWAEMIAVLDSHARAKPKTRVAAPRNSAPTAAIRPADAGLRLRLAAMAARQDSTGLSFQIVGQTLRHGPPVEPLAGDRAFGPEELRAAEDEIADRLIELDDLWREHRAPADRAYDTLASVVLPDSRPAEVFLYAHPITGSTIGARPASSAVGPVRPRSLGQRLADWAIRAGRVDDLRRRTEARVGQPQAEVAARVLLIQLALAGKEPKRALEALDGLRARLEKESVRSSAKLACHAALPALEFTETARAAAAVLERVLIVPIPARETVVRRRGRTMFTDSSTDAGLPDLVRSELARARFRAKDIAGARKLVHEMLAAASRQTNRYYYDRTIGLLAALNESVAAGQWSDAWDLLGKWLDLSWNAFEGAFPVADFGRMTAELAARPPLVRYDFIRTWVLPSGERKTLRLGGGTDSGEGRARAGRRPGPEPVSTFSLLIDSARAAGQLDALAAAVRPLVEQKTAHAETLALMIDVARGHADEVAPRLRRRADELAQKAARVEEAARTPGAFFRSDETPAVTEQAADMLLALNCLADPRFREIGAALAGPLTGFQDHQPTLPGLAALLRRDAAVYRVSQATGVERVSAHDLGLSLWRPDAAHEPGGPASGWVEYEGHLRLIPGSEATPLRFVYPLAGTFELAFEATGSGHVEFGGQKFLTPGTQAPAIPPGRYLPAAVGDESAFHRHRIRIGPDKVRCWIDGRLVYESDDLGRAQPWLTLSADAPSSRTPVFRNLSLSGRPEVPREVHLLAGSTLRWRASPSIPLGHRVVDSAQYGPIYDDDGNMIFYRSAPTPPAEPAPSTWSLKEGRLVRDRVPSPGPDSVPDRLDYERPLQSGDSVRYEFLYEPGETQVHPALGRVVFAVEPDGVQVHGREWAENAPAGSGSRDDPAPGRRLGPEKPPLKPGDWNEIILSLRANRITLELNGAAIYERELDRGDVPRFGLFHFRDRTAVSVRNVVLRGDWPQAFSAEQVADLMARPSGWETSAERRLRHAWFGEAVLRQNALHVLTRARALPPSQRYDALRAWVMPEGAPVPPRMDGVFPPCDPAPPVADAIRPSSNLVAGASPAADLVAEARRAGRLDELETSLRDANGRAAEPGRERVALAVLLAVARERDAEVKSALARLGSLLARTKADPAVTFWPEFGAASAALSRPALRTDASQLLTALCEALGSKGDQDPLSMGIRHLAAMARRDGPPHEPAAVEPLLDYWRSLAPGTSSTRGNGLPLPFWTWRDGELRHHPGHGEDQVIFSVPLRGDLEFSCELSLDDRRSTQVVYGGVQLEVAPDGKSYEIRQGEGPPRSFPLEPALDTRDEWHTYGLTAHRGRAEIAVDGRLIHVAGLPGEADPWLSLRQLGRREGGVRKLRLTGSPEIPERLALAAGPALTGWSATYFGGTTTQLAPWEQFGAEIRGRPATVAAGRHQQSLLQYHRPLFEDGSVEYEFFDGLGHAMVHPALDRMVFVLGPEGVRIHWLTDALHDRTDLTSGNRADEPACRRGPVHPPLRVGAWNRLRLTIVGQRATLQLNGVDIYERDLEPSNNRIFGLFHESDEGEVRARGVQYQGRWPRRLPAASELMAASHPADR